MADDLPANIVLEIERARGALQRGKTADPVNMAVRFKNLDSTDPRDKIYAFLSLSSNPRAFVDIYCVSPEELFISTAHNAIEHTYRNREGMAYFDETQWHPIPFVIQGPAQRMMSLLCSAGLANHTGQYALPSWVPDWSFSDFAPFIWPKFTFQTATRSANFYGSLGMSTVSTQVIHSLPTTNLVNLSWEHSSLDPSSTMIGNYVPNRLVLEGLLVETIQLSTGSSHSSVTLEDEQRQLEEWFLLADSVAYCTHKNCGKPLDDEQNRRFSKTLCMDKIDLVDSKDLKPLPGPLKFPERRSFRGQMVHQLDVVEYWTALPNARYREFFSTLSKHFGLGPMGTTCGDEIWNFAGLDTPLLLRPDGDEYFLIGECYVEDDGVMSWIRDLLPAELGKPIRKQPLENWPAVQQIVLK